MLEPSCGSAERTLSGGRSGVRDDVVEVEGLDEVEQGQPGEPVAGCHRGDGRVDENDYLKALGQEEATDCST
jgi:hypothetical protein